MIKPVTMGPWTKGLDASTGELSQSKGAVPRASNLLLTKRGSLKSCDGSALVNAFNGVPTLGRGRDLCDFFYQPVGVAPYYLRIMKALDQPLGPPKNLAVSDGGAGGTLAAATYFYKVTALDNVGGETTASNEASVAVALNHKVNLTWNAVPNTVFYNVYRSTSSGAEVLLIGTGFPVAQPVTTTVSFTDLGTATAGGVTLSVISINETGHPTGSSYLVLLNSPFTATAGMMATYSAGSDPSFNGPYTVTFNSSNNVVACTGPGRAGGNSTGGTLFINQAPPVVDTSQQTGLYAMPPAANGTSYSNANLVALFPADNRPIDGDPGGGGGGGGTGGGGGSQGSTASGGILGNVSYIPQMVQFTNQAVLALGNGFPPQIYSDPNGTTTNPASSVAISAISVDANGVVTITTATAHGIPTGGVGANVVLAGITNALYNLNGTGASAFPTITIPSATQVKIVNLSVIGQGASSGGTLTVSTIPVISTFVPSYPIWTTAVSYAVNSIITPTVSNGHYYKAIQAGTSGGAQPTFPTGTGQQVADGSVIWREGGLLNSAAPPPPGCAHVCVYAGSLWMLNTAPSNTANGLDGPTCLRMCDVNNPNSWNPINQAFLDKDDGTDGMGLSAFTITAQGIPPQGSLCAFKLYATYQIVGVFGSANFAIQRAETDMGLVAPRTLQFAPGFGLMRMTHLGYSVFDGVTDRVVSPQIEPYLFAQTDPDLSDIVPIDPKWMALSQSAQTAIPPMYISAIPVGTSNGLLTRILCFDLVLKAWSVVDLPFPISALSQARSAVSPVVTLLGSATDGTLQRWQAGDVAWVNGPMATTASTTSSWSNEITPLATFVVASTVGFVQGYTATVKGNSNPFFNGNWQVWAVYPSFNQIILYIPGTQPIQAPPQTGSGGTVSLSVTSPVSWMVRSPSVASKDAYVRLYARRVIVRGQQNSSTMSINVRVAGVYQGAQSIPMPASGDIQVQGSVNVTHDRFDADISGQGQVVIDAIIWDVVPKPAGCLAGMIS